MTNLELPAAAVPLLAALGPGLAAAAFLVVRRTASVRLSERSRRKQFDARMTIRAVHTRPLSRPRVAAAARPGHADPAIGVELLLPEQRVEGAA